MNKIKSTEELLQQLIKTASEIRDRISGLDNCSIGLIYNTDNYELKTEVHYAGGYFTIVQNNVDFFFKDDATLFSNEVADYFFNYLYNELTKSQSRTITDRCFWIDGITLTAKKIIDEINSRISQGIKNIRFCRYPNGAKTNRSPEKTSQLFCIDSEEKDYSVCFEIGDERYHPQLSFFDYHHICIALCDIQKKFRSYKCNPDTPNEFDIYSFVAAN